MQLIVQEHTMTERVRTNPSLNSPLGFCCHEQQHHHLLDVLYTISIQGKEKSPMKPSISNLKVSFPRRHFLLCFQSGIVEHSWFTGCPASYTGSWSYTRLQTRAIQQHSKIRMFQSTQESTLSPFLHHSLTPSTPDSDEEKEIQVFSPNNSEF